MSGPNLGALRTLLAGLLTHLTWRHHGIGVLQAYVREHQEPEMRVHIWHPSLVRKGIRDHGDAHDHRFDLESTVLVGNLYETLYIPASTGCRLCRGGGQLETVLGVAPCFRCNPESPNYIASLRTAELVSAPRFDVWHVENARSAGPERGFDGECRPLESDAPMEIVERLHPEGTTYGLPRGHFHRTSTVGLAITLCTMREKRGQARLLVPAGTEPVHAFGAHSLETQAARDLQQDIVIDAIGALQSVAGER